MSTKTIIHEINKIDNLNDLEEVLQVCRRSVQRLRQQTYEVDVSSSIEFILSNAKRGDKLKISFKPKVRDVFEDGEELQIFEILEDSIVVKSSKTGNKHTLSKEEIHRYGLGKEDSLKPKEVRQKRTKDPKEKPDKPPKDDDNNGGGNEGGGGSGGGGGNEGGGGSGENTGGGSKKPK